MLVTSHVSVLLCLEGVRAATDEALAALGVEDVAPGNPLQQRVGVPGGRAGG